MSKLKKAQGTCRQLKRVINPEVHITFLGMTSIRINGGDITREGSCVNGCQGTHPTLKIRASGVPKSNLGSRSGRRRPPTKIRPGTRFHSKIILVIKPRQRFHAFNMGRSAALTLPSLVPLELGVMGRIVPKLAWMKCNLRCANIDQSDFVLGCLGLVTSNYQPHFHFHDLLLLTNPKAAAGMDPQKCMWHFRNAAS
jgi:hypothetical protein